VKALVTGGAGFIGSHIVEELLNRGDFVRVLDNFSSGKRENLENLKGHPEIVEGDLRDAVTVQSAVRGIEVVYHLAALVSVAQSMQDAQTCFNTNAGGTVTLLEASRQAGVRKVILSSSTAVYGDTDRFPTDEQTPLKPLSPYALSKQVNELYASLYTRVFKLPVTPLRYFNVYGPRQRPDSDYAAAIPIFISNLVSGEDITIYGDGGQSRDFVFVKDIVRANLLAAQSTFAGEPLNVCTGKETTLLDLMEELSEIAPKQPKVNFTDPRPGDIYRSVGKPDKAKEKIDFEAATGLSQGLKQTIQWMRAR
jgi:UDP-glucose 4-epimerase